MQSPNKIILAIGSNNNAESNIALAKMKIQSLFKDVVFTEELWTDPIDMPEGTEPFLNCLAKGYTRHGLSQIKMGLKRLERECGNSKAKRSGNIIVLDVDVLQYGDEKLKESDWQRYYIKKLIRQL